MLSMRPDRWTAFFAAISLSGQRPIRIVHTSRFAARALAFASDGGVWRLGARFGSSLDLREAPDHFIVKYLGQDDVLKGEYVLRSTISRVGHAAMGGLARVLPSADRIGFFMPRSDYWVELKPNGDRIGKWHWSRKIPGDGDGKNEVARRVLTVALAENGELYAEIQENSGSSV